MPNSESDDTLLTSIYSSSLSATVRPPSSRHTPHPMPRKRWRLSPESASVRSVFVVFELLRIFYIHIVQASVRTGTLLLIQDGGGCGIEADSVQEGKCLPPAGLAAVADGQFLLLFPGSESTESSLHSSHLKFCSRWCCSAGPPAISSPMSMCHSRPHILSP